LNPLENQCAGIHPLDMDGMMKSRLRHDDEKPRSVGFILIGALSMSIQTFIL
jgi:hypothetical protein